MVVGLLSPMHGTQWTRLLHPTLVRQKVLDDRSASLVLNDCVACQLTFSILTCYVMAVGDKFANFTCWMYIITYIYRANHEARNGCPSSEARHGSRRLIIRLTPAVTSVLMKNVFDSLNLAATAH